MDGVLLDGVPGTGGFDAVFAMTLGDSSSKVTKAWPCWLEKILMAFR